MAKPTDDMPDVTPEKKKRKKKEAIQSVEPESAKESELTPESAEGPSSENPAQVDTNPDLSTPENPISNDDITQSDPELSEKEAFLTAEGEDPVAISMQIQKGEDGDTMVLDNMDSDSLLQQVAGVFLLWWHWAYFEITVTSPSLPRYNPPKIVSAATIAGSDEREFVYDIVDWGYKLATSKGEEMYSAGMSMCKMFYTIEKMIFILIQRIKDEGINTETEVQVSFDGHLLAQRKAFESIINLNYNVVVTNFDPGVWGERYLEIVKRMSERGYGYPSEAPREIYKINKRTPRPGKP